MCLYFGFFIWSVGFSFLPSYKTCLRFGFSFSGVFLDIDKQLLPLDWFAVKFAFIVTSTKLAASHFMLTDGFVFRNSLYGVKLT